jgi:hypothetical protein
MNREIAQIKRIKDSQILTRGIKIGVWRVFAAAVASCLLCSAVLLADDDDRPFLPGPVRVVSTVPATGDQNPYGVAFVPPGFPETKTIHSGDVLVSNFNNAANLQGTGTTIVDVPANAPVSVFFQGTAPLGLTTALNILRKGFVLVGNFPSPDDSGKCQTALPGSILVINNQGTQVGTITEMINGPWDSALFDEGGRAKYFVANALDGTIVRFDLDVNAATGVTVDNATKIASGYKFACDATTFVDAPTGLVYDPEKDVLYVASTVDNAVYAVRDAGDRRQDGGVGRPIYEDTTHLHGALGLAMAPNGHLLVTNNDVIYPDPNQPSELVEFTVGGEFVKEISLDPTPGGSFGLAVENLGNGTSKLAAVDDSVNLFLIWTLKLHE